VVAPGLKAVTTTLIGTSVKAPVASVIRSEKTLVVAAAGVAEKTRLKSPLKVSGIWPATLGAVNTTGLAPLIVQVSIELTAERLTSEYESLAYVHPAGMLIATLLTFAQPLLTTSKLNSTPLILAVTVAGFTTAANVPRVVDGVEVDVGVVIDDPLRVPVADPLKVNGFVVPVALSWYAQVKAVLPDAGILATDAGVGPVTILTGAPATGVRVGVTALTGNTREPLVTVMVTVTFEPAYWQDGATPMLATKELTDRVPEVAVVDVTVPPL